MFNYINLGAFFGCMIRYIPGWCWVNFVGLTHSGRVRAQNTYIYTDTATEQTIQMACTNDDLDN